MLNQAFLKHHHLIFLNFLTSFLFIDKNMRHEFCEKSFLFCEMIDTCKLQKFINNVAHTNIQIIISSRSLIVQKKNAKYSKIKSPILKILNWSMDGFLIYHFYLNKSFSIIYVYNFYEHFPSSTHQFKNFVKIYSHFNMITLKISKWNSNFLQSRFLYSHSSFILKFSGLL